eukprot:gene7071-14382_t
MRSIRINVRGLQTARRLRGFDAPTVWQEFTPLSIKHKSANLGQGFPDWETPQFVKDTLSKAVNENFNQYCRSGGENHLVESLAKHYSPLVGRTIDPMTEVTVSVGATEAMFGLMQAIINDEDEVILIEPAFDIYPAQVQMAGGVCVYVPLRANPTVGNWTLDMNELEAAITPKTKLLILNTPHNPTGKILTQSELEDIAGIIRRHPHITVVMDEVYEKLVYDGKKHIRLASLPDMWERVLTVSSCGKSFSCTGWKVGWVYGHSSLIKPIMLANQWVQFSVSTPTQKAISEVLTLADNPYEGYASYYDYVRELYRSKRDHLIVSLEAAQLRPYVPEGGFFIMADTSAHSFPDRYANIPGPSGEVPVTRDWAFASAFYTPSRKIHGANLARFAFCKTDPTLQLARERLEKLGKSMRTKQ